MRSTNEEDRYLDQSTVSKLIRSASVQNLDSVASELSEWNVFSNDGDHDKKLLASVIDVLNTTTPHKAVTRDQFVDAIDQMHEALGFDSTVESDVSPQADAVSGVDCSSEQNLFVHLGAAYSREKSTAFWVVHDMLKRWLLEKEETTYQASTKVLFDEGLFLLTVELFEEKGGPFSPDLFYLGLTDIKPTMLDSMEKCWNISGLGSRFRGRWRIENVSEVEKLPSSTSFPHSLSGNSAEAATLCALLAASGDPYCNESESPKSEPIDQSVAISATIVESDKSVLDRELGHVKSMDRKVHHGIQNGLTTVFFSSEKSDNRKAAFDADKEELGDNREAEYSGLVVHSLETVRDAIDNLLLTNRFLKAYQESVKKSWLSQWESGTADLKPSESKVTEKSNNPVER